MGTKTRQSVMVLQKMITRATMQNWTLGWSLVRKDTAAPMMHMMPTLYTLIPMYLLSLRAGMLTFLVSQARKQPNNCRHDTSIRVHFTLLHSKWFALLLMPLRDIQNTIFMSTSFPSPLAAPCRRRRCPARWSYGCSHSVPRRDGWIYLCLGGPPGDTANTQRERERVE